MCYKEVEVNIESFSEVLTNGQFLSLGKSFTRKRKIKKKELKRNHQCENH